MSTIITKNGQRNRDSEEPSGNTAPDKVGEARDQEDSRQQFYLDYREAVRALRRGEPERFIAYQSDHRISPPREGLSLPPRPSADPANQGSQVSVEQLKDEVRFSVISLMSSVSGMVTALGRLLS